MFCLQAKHDICNVLFLDVLTNLMIQISWCILYVLFLGFNAFNAHSYYVTNYQKETCHVVSQGITNAEKLFQNICLANLFVDPFKTR